MGLFNNRDENNGKTQVPVWFMRQAGRYHAHYQNIKKNSDFMSMCKTPDLACEVTMGPIEDFDFDAAILFSDLLFPLEQLNMGLNYLQGPPELGFHLNQEENYQKLKVLAPAQEFYDFQAQALTLLKEKLPQNKTLLGFVGAPFTLFTYATEGSHKGFLTSTKTGLYDGRFERFMETLYPELLENMKVQAQGGADALCLFDTAAGELCFKDYQKFMIPWIRKIAKDFKQSFPNKEIVYYSKYTHLKYLQAIESEHIDVLGIDWRNDLAEVINTLGKDYYIQGNIDPCWLHLPWNKLEENLEGLKIEMLEKKVDFSKWIFGLGHGVIIQTPEENVRNTVQWVKRSLLY